MTKTQTSWLTVLLWLIAMFYNLFTQKFQYEFHLEHNGRTHSYQCVALFANSSSVMSSCSWCQFQRPASRRSKYLDPPFRPSFHWGQLLARHSLAAFWRIGCLWDTGRRHLVGNMLTLVCTPVVLTFGWPWPVLLSPMPHPSLPESHVFSILSWCPPQCVSGLACSPPQTPVKLCTLSVTVFQSTFLSVCAAPCQQDLSVPVVPGLPAPPFLSHRADLPCTY